MSGCRDIDCPYISDFKLARYKYKVPNIKVPNHKIPNNIVPKTKFLSNKVPNALNS
jgi:hypothetical protein